MCTISSLSDALHSVISSLFNLHVLFVLWHLPSHREHEMTSDVLFWLCKSPNLNIFSVCCNFREGKAAHPHIRESETIKLCFSWKTTSEMMNHCVDNWLVIQDQIMNHVQTVLKQDALLRFLICYVGVITINSCSMLVANTSGSDVMKK